MNAKTIRLLFFFGEAAGLILFIAGPVRTTAAGLVVFAAASFLKDTENRIWRFG